MGILCKKYSKTIPYYELLKKEMKKSYDKICSSEFNISFRVLVHKLSLGIKSYPLSLIKLLSKIICISELIILTSSINSLLAIFLIITFLAISLILIASKLLNPVIVSILI